MRLWCFLLLLCASAPGQDDPFTEEALTARVAALVPDVEAVLGAKLPTPIPVRVVSRRDLEEIYLRELGPQRGGAPMAAALRTRARQRARYTIAALHLSTGELRVCPANLRQLAEAAPEWKAAIGPDYLDLVLAHELVHAYQRDQFGSRMVLHPPDGLEEAAALSAVLEGHAQYVTRRVADRRGQSAAFDLGVSMLTDLPGSLTDESLREGLRLSQGELRFSYVAGERFVDAVVERLGYALAVRTLFFFPPRTTAAISDPGEYFEPRKESFDLERAGLDIGRLIGSARTEVVPRSLLEAELKPLGVQPDGFRRAIRLTGEAEVRIEQFDAANGAEQFHAAALALQDLRRERLSSPYNIQRLLEVREDARRLNGSLVHLTESVMLERRSGEHWRRNTARFVTGPLAVEIEMSNRTDGNERTARIARRVHELLSAIRGDAPATGWGARWREARDLSRARTDRERAEITLLQLTTDEVADVRLAAFDSLAALGGNLLADPLAEKDPDWEVRERFWKRLASHTGRDPVVRATRLIEALSDPHPGPRVVAFDALHELKADDSIPWPVLRGSLGHPAEQVRRRALRAITWERLPNRWGTRKGELEPLPLTEIAPILLGALNDEISGVRERASYLLIVLPSNAPGLKEALIKALDDESYRVRTNALYAVAELGKQAEPAIDRIIELLDDRLLAAKAAECLGAIGESARRAVPAIRPLLEREESEVRFAAAGALIDLGEDGKPFVAILLETLRDGEHYDRDDAARLLGRVGPDAAGAVPDLIEALASDNERLQRQAARALGAMGETATSAIPALKKLAAESKGPVGVAARRAIDKIRA